MKNLDFGKLLVKSYSQEDVIEWLATASINLVKDLTEAAVEQNMGKTGACSVAAMTIASVCKALNEDVNGKKESVVL